MYTITDFLNDEILAYQVSDERELIWRYADRVYIEAGGFVDTAGTHYARLKAEVSIPAGVKFWQTATIELPADFYEQQTASLKVITAGDSVGTYRRIGLWIDQACLPRLQSETKGASDPLITLWQGKTSLPLGRHDYAVEIVPSSVDGVALLRLYVDGVVWGESTKANYNAAEVNRLVWGVDGAASQDTKQLSLTLWKVGLDDYIEIDPCIAKRERLEKARVEQTDARADLKLARSLFDEEKTKYIAALTDLKMTREKFDAALAEYLAALADMEGC
jgi:hypothetical protein